MLNLLGLVLAQLTSPGTPFIYGGCETIMDLRGGTFIDHEHTYDNRHNMSHSLLYDRPTRDQWMAATGERDLTERAYGKAREIVANHDPFPLPEGAAEIMAAIIA